MKTVAVIQCNHVGWEGSTDVSLRRDLNGRYVIEEVMERAKLLKAIDSPPILACPDLAENRLFEDLALKHECEIYFGSNNNVLERIMGACRKAEGNRIAWLQGIHYFLDTALMDQFLVWSNEYDYARCPDASLKFMLGQSINLDALLRVPQLIAALEPQQRAFFGARPFSFMRTSPTFSIGLFQDLPNYSVKETQEMRSIAQHIYIEQRSIHTDKAEQAGDISIGRYKNIISLIPETGRILDIACGTGYGCKMISNGKREIIGVDIAADAINFADVHNGAYANFLLGDAESMPVESDSVDCLISIATIEHVPDDHNFIKEIHRVLKKKSSAIIFTPQNRMGKIPIWPWHCREYSLHEIKVLINQYMGIKNIFGWQHGVLSDDPIGDGMYIVAYKD